MEFLDVNSPQAGTASFLSAGPLPNRYNTAVPASSGWPGINDATVLLAPVGYEPVRRWAAFLGSTGSNQATLRFYDINAGTWPEPGPAVQTHTLSESNPNPYVSLADLELSPGGADVLARLTAPFAEPSPQQGGPDWSRWGGNPPAQSGGTIGGQGTCVGADSLRMRRRAAVSISQDTNSPTPAGFVHIVTVQ